MEGGGRLAALLRNTKVYVRLTFFIKQERKMLNLFKGVDLLLQNVMEGGGVGGQNWPKLCSVTNEWPLIRQTIPI